jgi:hypothetical protein
LIAWWNNDLKSGKSWWYPFSLPWKLIVLGVMTTAGCYIIPCMRGLVQRLIVTTLTNTLPSLTQTQSNKKVN